MQAIDALLERNSAVRLSEPAPQGGDRDTVLQAALRAPDHARLRPWRFLLIEAEARSAFGNLMAEVGALDKPDFSEADAERLRGKALRAPLLIVVAARVQEHPKVPEIEQLLSAGCAAMNMLTACHALGYGAIWRTGSLVYKPEMCRGLGLNPADHRLIGVLYIGTSVGKPKPLPGIDTADYFQSWSADQRL